MGVDRLMDELDCTRRTVYRDLDALRYAGFPVVDEKRDGRVFYQFIDTFGLGDAPFTPDEVLALALSEDLLRVLEGTIFHESVCSALAKLRACLGPELTQYVAKLEESLRIIPGPHKEYADAKESIRVLQDAVLTRTNVRMSYRSASSGGAETERSLDPYRVWYRAGGLYVVGFDHKSGELRTFAVERIRQIAPTKERFEIPESFDFDSFIGSAFGVISEEATHVHLRFVSSVAPYVEERTWHPSQSLQRDASGALELQMEVGDSTELRSWILSFGADALVLEPPSLREKIGRELRAASRHYDKDPGDGG